MSSRKFQLVFQAGGTLIRMPEPILPGTAMRLSYYNWHIPTGNVFRESELFLNRHAFESCLARWNQQGQGTWHYTEEEDNRR
jgi:hypothetical protein